MTTNTWNDYFEKTKNARPRKLLVEALPYVKDRNEALDLGSGALNDVRYLISENFKHVTAVDSTPISQEILSNYPADILSYIVSTFDTFNFPTEKYDLINAQYALPFNPPESFDKFFASIIESLKKDGVFTGQFFGDRDEWNTKGSNKTFHTKEQAENLLAGLNIISFTEEEKDGSTAAGNMKHWHLFHFIVTK